MQNINAEILAPAGNMLAFKTAINNGADAVYLGLSAFNARVKADNFTMLELQEAIKHAHLLGVRVYLAFNTLLKTEEIALALMQVKEAVLLGIDAIILQDLGLLASIRKAGISVELHASTQLGIHNLDGALMAQKLGFKRVILARETLLEDIVEIKKHTDLELEYFVHGALCVAFSGNCYFSSLVSGQSGNRGRCLQLCRKPYAIIDSKSKLNVSTKKELTQDSDYLLSPRDLCFVDHLKKLQCAGITSFKIEGRLRRAEYVGHAVRVYKKALSSKNISLHDANSLKVMFNRGNYSTGYLNFSKNTVIDTKYPSHIGLKVGTVHSITKSTMLPKAKSHKFASSNIVKIIFDKNAPKLYAGDGLKFMRNGYEVGSSLIEDINIITYTGDVMAGDQVMLTTSTELNNSILDSKRTLNVNATINIRIGKPAIYTLFCDDICVSSSSTNVVEKSLSAPLTKEKLQFLYKTGNKLLVMRDTILNLDSDCFMSIGELKQLRNRAIDELIYKKVLQCTNHKAHCVSFDKHNNCHRSVKVNLANILNRAIFVMVDNKSFITSKLLEKCDYIIFNPPNYNKDEIVDFFTEYKNKAILNLPIIARGKDLNIMRDIIRESVAIMPNCKPPKFVANNLWALEACKCAQIILGHGLNLLNKEVFNIFDCAHSTFIPAIASLESQSPQKGAINYIYGKVPLMTLASCPLRAKSSCYNTCKNESSNYNLVDSSGYAFNLRKIKNEHCYTEVLNSLPLDNRHVLDYADCSVLIDLTNVSSPQEKIDEIFAFKHSDLPHTHGNYKNKLA